MAYISCVLIDPTTRMLAPAVLDLSTFVITPISSTIDVVKGFTPGLVGIYTNDYKSPFRTYPLLIEDKKFSLKNSVAKAAVVRWSRAMPKGEAEKVLEVDQILKVKNYLSEAVVQNQASKAVNPESAKKHKI